MDNQRRSREILDLQIRYGGTLNRITTRSLIRGEDSLLLWLDGQEGEVFPTDIMRHFCLSSGRVANILKSAQKKNLIRRHQSGEDLRKNCIMITTEGKAYAHSCRSRVLQAQEEMLACLTPKDADALVNAFRELLLHYSADESSSSGF